MTAPTIDERALRALRAALQGQLYTPDDGAYDAARTPWQLHVEQRPAAVVMATSAADVVAAVTFARTHDLAIAIQGTGHGAVVACDGGLLINTALMQGVRIDPLARTAWLEAGVKWQAVLDAAHPLGLAPLLGSTPDVGAVGYSLGGGLGWLARKYGLAVDSVRAFDIVTADGQLRHVTAASDPELFWGVRGGGGNFGVVTAMEVELYPVAEVYGGNLYFPIAMARQVMLAYRRWITTLPDEWTTGVVLMHMPPDPALPEPLRGQSVVIVRGCYTGDAAAGEAWLRPMRELGGIIVDAFGPMLFRDVETISNDPLAPLNIQARTEVLRDLSPETIDALIAVAGRPPESPLAFAEVRHVGGAVNRAPADSSAFGHRDMEFILFLLAVVLDPAEDRAIDRYMRAAGAAIQPHQTGQIYLNFLHDSDITPARVRAAFPPQTYARLVALKDRYDPTNMFRFNRNIPPSATHGVEPVGAA
ncbi:MAG TPA: FAD-binding oxidoreductase [Roseiflexaceae bacterium]|nr:FAD-binding oxidoreductase [Roseiflexaceae bacterium]